MRIFSPATSSITRSAPGSTGHTRSRKNFLALIFLAGLTACATTGPGGAPGQVTSIDPVVLKIKAGILKACGFEVALPVLTQIINSLAPGAAPFTQLAAQVIPGVCQQVTAVPAPQAWLTDWIVSRAYAQAVPQFNGVVIRGACKVPARGCKR